MDGHDLRRRAVALAARLHAVDAERAALEDALAAAPTLPGAATPARRHPWPLADDPTADPDLLGPHDRRPDDTAIVEARRGEAFLQRFALAGPAPRIAAAARALVAAGRRLPWPVDGGEPDVSIVIPVHGQLGWTLNGLHALLAHAAQATCEVILVDDASPDATARVVADLAVALPGVRLLRHDGARGFGAACNVGAAAARGRLLVLLNNDTRVVEGWLDALIGSFALLPDAGLVGSKLLYPDGRLQEAGCILWRDGSAWNDGRGDDPNRPQFCHARRVDYPSAAAVALPLALWRAMDGFDGHFAPAYAEDADLALRLRAAGRGVWMQPQARVIHYEGRTAGTDLGQGAKAHQVANQARLFLRWRDALAHHRRNGEEPERERERTTTRRALVVDATTPTPDRDAGSVTTIQTLRLLGRLGYQAQFVPEDNFLFDPATTPALLREGVACAYAPYDTGIATLLERTGRQVDIALVYRVATLARALPALRQHAPAAPVLFHPMDLHHLRLAREAALRDSAALREEAEAMRRLELGLIARVDCVITHSTHERALLERAVPGTPAIVWPFMAEWRGTDAGFAERDGVCFLGGYRHPPNVDAALFFARDVLPRIRRRLPRATFTIAGADPPEAVRALAGAQVRVTGHVADLGPVLDAARVFVCPVRYGAGVKGKITTAMAHGLPVVTTSCGAEGMDLIDGIDVLVADGAAALARACVRLHEDAALWAALSARGQAIVRERHSLAMGEATLRRAIEAAFAHRLDVSA